jgi:hypothetical protein
LFWVRVHDPRITRHRTGCKRGAVAAGSRDADPDGARPSSAASRYGKTLCVPIRDSTPASYGFDLCDAHRLWIPLTEVLPTLYSLSLLNDQGPEFSRFAANAGSSDASVGILLEVPAWIVCAIAPE